MTCTENNKDDVKMFLLTFIRYFSNERIETLSHAALLKRSVHTPQTTTNFKMKTQAASASSLLHQLGKSCKVGQFLSTEKKTELCCFQYKSRAKRCLFGMLVGSAWRCVVLAAQIPACLKSCCFFQDFYFDSRKSQLFLTGPKLSRNNS